MRCSRHEATLSEIAHRRLYDRRASRGGLHRCVFRRGGHSGRAGVAAFWVEPRMRPVIVRQPVVRASIRQSGFPRGIRVLCLQLPGVPADMSLLNNPFDPAREAALVTGAGNGIGRAIAQALVGEGVRTVFADVNRGDGHRRGQVFAAAGTGIALDRRSRRSRRLRCAAGACARGARAGDAFRSQRLAAAARGRSRHGRQRRDVGADARGQSSTPAFTSRANWRGR